MKSIKYLLCALLATVFVGCAEDAAYEPGPEDTNTDCAALYFKDGQPTYVKYDKEGGDLMELEVKVLRAGSKSKAATHKLLVTSSAEDIFSATDIEFEAGSASATAKLLFPGAVPGTSYDVALTFEDQDKPIYSDNNMSYAPTIFIDYPWELYTAEDGSTTGLWTEGLIGGIFSGVSVATKEVEVWYTKGIPGLYRIENIYTADFAMDLFGSTLEEEEGCAIDPSTQESPIYTFIHAEDPDNVWIEFHDSGYYTGEGMGYFIYWSLVPENNVASGFVGDAANYGKNTDGYIEFPNKTVLVGLTEYDGGPWYGGSAVSLLLPGAVVPEPEVSQEWIDFELTSGDYDVNGLSYFSETGEWSAEHITIDYNAGDNSVSISGLFFGNSDVTIVGTYDKATQTISLPSTQCFGTFSFEQGDTGVYLLDTAQSENIMFTLAADLSSFTSSQTWGYYLLDLDGWAELYAESNITKAVAIDGGIDEFVTGTYALNGLSYFDKKWYTEEVGIQIDPINGVAYLSGLFFGNSPAVVLSAYDGETNSIAIKNGQYLGDFIFKDGEDAQSVYLVNAGGEDDIVFTLTERRAIETEQMWGYNLNASDNWVDVYAQSYFSVAPEAAEAPANISFSADWSKYVMPSSLDMSTFSAGSPVKSSANIVKSVNRSVKTYKAKARSIKASAVKFAR